MKLKKKEKEAIEVLIKHGLLKRISDPEISKHLYHGRAKKMGEINWEVNPLFNNAGNNTGNQNVNAIPTLYCSALDTAKEFALARAKSVNEAQVYEIGSSDEDALIFDRFRLKSFFEGEDAKSEKRKEVVSALKHLVTGRPISELIPAKFEDRKDYENVYKVFTELSREERNFLYDESAVKHIKVRLKENGLSCKNDDIIRDVIASYNTFQLIANGNINYLLHNYLSPQSDYFKRNILINGKFYPFSSKYMTAWLEKMNVIGCFGGVDSATLDKRIKVISIFNLDKINTSKVVKSKKETTKNRYKTIDELIGHALKGKNKIANFDLSLGCKEIMDELNKNEKYKRLFDLDAGLWEGFSIGEHTETVLRVFEDSFEEDLNGKFDHVIPFVKLAIIAHDLSKGKFVQRKRAGEFAGKPDYEVKKIEAEYVKSVAKEFFDDYGVDPRLQKLLLFVIGESQKFTTDYLVKGNDNKWGELREKCGEILKEVFPEQEVTSRGKISLQAICEILQTCDSGAYTRMGITRDKKTGKYYFNGNDRFTESFKTPTDPAGRKQRLKNG